MSALYSEIKNSPTNNNYVFLHGNLSSHAWWSPLLDNCEDNEFKSLVLDWRGCGNSEYWNNTDTHVTLEDLTDDICTSIRKTFKDQEFILVGHSLGGLLASLVAEKLGTQAQRMLLLSPVSPKGIQFDPSMYEAFDKMAADKDFTSLVIMSTIYDSNLDENLQNTIKEHAFKAVQHIGRDMLECLKSIDYSSRLKELNIPTKVYWGEHDNIIPESDVQYYSEVMPNCIYEKVENQGHCWNIENPDTLKQELVKFSL